MTLRELVERKYQERHRRAMEEIINGVKDYNEYMFLRGYLRGMHDLLDDIEPYIRDPDAANDEE